MSMVQFSAVSSGVKDARAAIETARRRGGKGTLLFVDEIHRFNRAQQDAFLSAVEDGTITLIGATTENPSFEVNSALLSRCVVYRLRALTDEELRTVLGRALGDAERGVRGEVQEEALEALVGLANGDARAAMNLLEFSLQVASEKAGSRPVSRDLVLSVAQQRVLSYDRDREEHFNVVSAFIKSMRGSDPDAGLYWLARMLEAGEDPLFIARRMVIFASEDIGNADPQALQVAACVKEAVDFVGMPEGYLPLAQGVTYLATAPKSNASYVAYLKAKEEVEGERNEPVPLHLRNAVTPLMKDSGYGKGYLYPHDQPDAAVGQSFRPPNVEGHVYYRPKGVGFEREILARMAARSQGKSAP
jgi:putative ATPase